jgi:hypothetical protein
VFECLPENDCAFLQTQIIIIIIIILLSYNWESSVGIVIRLRVVRPRNRCSIPGRCKRFSLLKSLRTVSVFHPSFYTLGTGTSFSVLNGWEAQGKLYL